MPGRLKTVLFTITGFALAVIAVPGFILTTFNNEDYRKSLTFLVNNLSAYQISIDNPFKCEISVTPRLTAARIRILPPGPADPLEFKNITIKLRPQALLRGRLRLIVSGLIDEAKTLKYLLPKELSALKAVRFNTEFSTDTSMLDLHKFTADGRNRSGLALKLSGTGLIENLSAPQPFTKLDLTIKVNSRKSRPLQGYLPEKLPEIGPVHGSLRLIAISDSALAAQDIKLDFGRKDKLYLQARGRINHIPIDPETINTGNDFHLLLQTVTTADLAVLIPPRVNKPLPEIGPLTISADFRGSKKRARLENISFRNQNPTGLEIRINGKLALSGADRDAGNPVQSLEFDTSITAPAGARLPDFSSLQVIFCTKEQDLTVRKCSDKTYLRTEMARLGCGICPRISKTTDQNLRVPPSGPLRASGKLTGDRKKISLKNFSAQIGKTAITAEIDAAFTDKLPLISGKIVIPTLFPNDFPGYSDTPESSPQPQNAKKNLSDKKKPAAAPELFSRQPLSWDWLRRLNSNIRLYIKNIATLQNNFKNLELAIIINDGRLKIDPITFAFEGGYADISLFIDDTNSIPTMKLNAAVNDLDLNGFLKSLAVNAPIAGKLTLHSRFSSRGRSPHDLAANLSGDFGMALEEGVVPSHVLKLIAVDLLGWSFSRSVMKKKHTEINCCILGFAINQGIITNQAFIFDSKNLTITGAGTIDLKTETCDLTILPKKKRKFWAMVTPVKISGPLRNPHILAIPYKKAALLYGGILLAPQFFLPAVGINYLWEMISRDGGAKNPCLEYLHQHSLPQAKKPAQTLSTKTPPAPQPASKPDQKLMRE